MPGGNERNSRTTFPHKQQRRKAAQERQAEYDKLSLEQKLVRATIRGHSESKECKKIRAKIARAK